jgi:hypothetical protein
MSREQQTKPAYRDRYSCEACGTGYLDCAALAVSSMKCCKYCDGHPGRWAAGAAAYTAAEIQDMANRQKERP